jgi:hypothetical protein
MSTPPTKITRTWQINRRIYYLLRRIAYCNGIKEADGCCTVDLSCRVIAFDKVIKEVIYIRKLAVDLGLQQDDSPICVHTDSNNAMDLIKKEGFQTR